jgi:23S rRNA pseudouridine1911/1915/1917 synthase
MRDRQAIIVSRREAGRTVGAVLGARLGLAPAAARRMVGERRVRVGGAPCLDPSRRVRAGQRIEVQPRPPAAAPTHGVRPRIAFADAHVVVVDKPAGLTTMRHAYEAAEFGARGRTFLPPTLADLLPALLAEKGSPGSVRAVHRIDKETSGLVVFARTPASAHHLGRQFREHRVERRYLALVRGPARDARIESYLARDRGDGRRGSFARPGAGERAVTHIRVVERLGDFTLVECRLETGRTHQVRIHLGESGTPLCGERIYDRPLHGKPVSADKSGMRRPALHAARLGFIHPVSGKHVAWSAALPKDMASVLARLRRAARSAEPET